MQKKNGHTLLLRNAGLKATPVRHALLELLALCKKCC